jgi:tetratricopeptide (TPR) repeat protein
MKDLHPVSGRPAPCTGGEKEGKGKRRQVALLRCLAGLLGFLLGALPATAQFEGAAPGARAVALGKSLVVGSDDACAVFWNPAALAEVRQPTFVFDFRRTYELQSFAASLYDPENGGFGFALWHNPRPGGGRNGAIAWSRRLAPGLCYGLTAALTSQDSAQSYTYGFGLSWRPLAAPGLPGPLSALNAVASRIGEVQIGAAYLGLPIAGPLLHRELRVGLSWRPIENGPQLLLAQHWTRRKSTGHVGLEVPLEGRSGFLMGSEGWDVRKLALGLRLHWTQLRVEVVYSATSQRLIMTFAFLLGENPALLAEHHFARSTQLAKEKKLREALSELNKVVAFAPEDHRAWEMRQAVARVVRREDAQLDSLFRHAESLRRKGDLVSAALEFSQILERNPNHRQARQKLNVLRPTLEATARQAFQLGVKFYDQEDYLKARAVFERVLLINPNHERAQDYLARTRAILHTFAEDHFLQGLGFYRQRNLTRAYEEFSLALEYDPDYVEARKYFEQVAEEKGNLEKMLDRLLAEGEELARKGNAIQASIKFRKILEVDTGNPVARQKLIELQPLVDQHIQQKLREGKKALAEGKLKAARAAFREILTVVPTHQEAIEYDQRAYDQMVRMADQYYQSGLVEYESGNYEKALQQFERALVLIPNHAGATRMRRQTFSMIGMRELIQKAKESYEQGDYVRAMAVFSQILENDPDNAVALQYVERCQQRLNELAEGHFNRGITLYTAEDYVAAIEELDKALELNPNHRGAQEYKRRAEARLQALRSLR